MVGELNILVVDDESGLADLYTVWLSDDHDVETAYGGEEAIEKLDAETDIVFLDRRMPQMSGDEVLAAIRDRELDCQVAMVTGVDADFDIIDVPFDAYLSKPVSEDDFEAVIERLRRRSAYDDALQRYFSLVSRQTTLQAEKQPEQLAGNDDYTELVEEIERCREELDSLTDQLDETDAKVFFADL
jgi:DNA-binding response OmpR family regulator